MIVFLVFNDHRDLWDTSELFIYLSFTSLRHSIHYGSQWLRPVGGNLKDTQLSAKRIMEHV